MKWMLIAMAGGFGSLMRYLVSGWGQSLTVGSFPLGTLLVNVVGCLLIGVLAAVFSGPVLIREEYRLALMVGALGGFTTFSSFGYETFALMNDGATGYALLNIVLSVVLGLAGVWIGFRVAEVWFGV